MTPPTSCLEVGALSISQPMDDPYLHLKNKSLYCTYYTENIHIYIKSYGSFHVIKRVDNLSTTFKGNVYIGYRILTFFGGYSRPI